MILLDLPPGTTPYRAHTPQWASRPTSGAGAAAKGGRFNREGVEALYLSLDEVTALREYQQTSPFLPPPWVLGDMVLAQGHTGILFPSQANDGATNAVVYVDRLRDGNSVEVNDPGGRLPRDQSSWNR